MSSSTINMQSIKHVLETKTKSKLKQTDKIIPFAGIDLQSGKE